MAKSENENPINGRQFLLKRIARGLKSVPLEMSGGKFDKFPRKIFKNSFPLKSWDITSETAWDSGESEEHSEAITKKINKNLLHLFVAFFFVSHGNLENYLIREIDGKFQVFRCHWIFFISCFVLLKYFFIKRDGSKLKFLNPWIRRIRNLNSNKKKLIKIRGKKFH